MHTCSPRPPRRTIHSVKPTLIEPFVRQINPIVITRISAIVFYLKRSCSVIRTSLSDKINPCWCHRFHESSPNKAMAANRALDLRAIRTPTMNTDSYVLRCLAFGIALHCFLLIVGRNLGIVRTWSPASDWDRKGVHFSTRTRRSTLLPSVEALPHLVEWTRQIISEHWKDLGHLTVPVESATIAVGAHDHQSHRSDIPRESSIDLWGIHTVHVWLCGCVCSTAAASKMCKLSTLHPRTSVGPFNWTVSPDTSQSHRQSRQSTRYPLLHLWECQRRQLSSSRTKR